MERLIARNNLTETQARDRINSQMNLAEKCRLANIIIDNSKSFDFTKQQVKLNFNTLNNSLIIWRNRTILLAFFLGSITLLVFAISKLFSIFL